MRYLQAFVLCVLVPLAVLLVGAAVGCSTTGPFAQPSIEFTKAARGYVDTLGAEYKAYVLADESLTPVQKQNRLDAVGDFDFAVRQAELAVGLIFVEVPVGTPPKPPPNEADEPPAGETVEAPDPEPNP